MSFSAGQIIPVGGQIHPRCGAIFADQSRQQALQRISERLTTPKLYNLEPQNSSLEPKKIAR